MSEPTHLGTFAFAHPVNIRLSTSRSALLIAGEERDANIKAEEAMRLLFERQNEDVKIDLRAKDSAIYARTFQYLQGLRTELNVERTCKAKGTWPSD